MRAHINYFLYVIRHKYFVFLACMKLGVPLWQAVVHDWTKFLPSEWFPYVRSFYNPDGSKKNVKTNAGTIDKSKTAADFSEAWNQHQKFNKHHWQYWLLINDEDGIVPLEIPHHYLLELLADWDGAGRAVTGKSDPGGWYTRNANKMIMHRNSRYWLMLLLEEYYGWSRPAGEWHNEVSNFQEVRLQNLNRKQEQ